MILRKLLMLVLLAITVCVMSVAVGAAAVFTVDDDGGAMYTSIQAAIDDASSGDEIHVYSGTYYENVNVNKRLTLRGIDTGAGMPVVNASGSGSAIALFADRITLEGFKVINSDPWANAGIIVFSNSNTLSGNNVLNNYNLVGIYLSHSSNNMLSDNTANADYGSGIYLFDSHKNILNENIATSRDYGIYLESSSNNILNSNTAPNNKYGIYLSSSSNNNILRENTATENYFGIYLSSVSNNTLNGNILNSNIYDGICLSSSSNNTLSGNTAKSNKVYGIRLSSSSNNTLSDNNASNNRYGIYLEYFSNNNILFHNNLIDNTYSNAYDPDTNQWDSSTEGNYWSDYTGTDSNGDGIGDTPYPIPAYHGTSEDRYPLMAPYSLTPPPSGFTVGQGAPTPAIEQLFIDTYNRNGGVGVLGDPTTEVHNAWGYLVQDFPGASGYAGGIIMYNPNENSAYYIHGKIWDRYYSLGGPIAKTDIEFQLGLPINDVLPYVHSEPPLISSQGSQYRYQNFAGETEMAALEYNLATGEVYEIHGAIYATWSAMGYANSILGLVTSDEREAVPSFKGTTGRVSDFENGHLHWHSSGDHYMVTYMTYGDLDELSVSMGGTASWLGFPVMDQEDRGGYGYCEFEGGYIEWDGSEYKAVPITGPVHNINKGTDYTTIQAAIDDASPGNEIHVDSGTYYENVVVNKQLILRGIDTGAGMPVVDAGRSGSPITLSAGWSTIDGFIVTNSSDGPRNAGIMIISTNNTIKNNIASNNWYGISTEAFSTPYTIGNNNISGNNLSNNDYGIHLYYSNNNNIKENNISNIIGASIIIYRSNDNTISNNDISSSSTGIYLWANSNNNTLINNDIPSGGIRLYQYCNNNILSGNNVSNSYFGILLHMSSNNTFRGNNVSNNSEGIYLQGSNGNNLNGNIILKNKDYGIRIFHTYGGSHDNKLSNNNIIENGIQALDLNNDNFWNSSYPIGGNYWSDYNEVDSLSGPNQDQPGSDGIGDTPYPIAGSSSVDRYPLMNPWTAPPLSGKIAFASFRDGNQEVYVMNADGNGDPINLTNRPDADDGDPTWSPDGKQIAFSSNRSGNWKTYVMNADGSDQVCLLEGVYDAWGPAWSPDGTKIAVACKINPTDDFEIYTVDIQSRALTQVTDNNDADCHPSWSPDSHKIVFTSDRDVNQEIYVADLLADTQTKLTDEPAYDDYPEWSPDGSMIAFVSERDGNLEIYSMDIASKAITRLTYSDSIDKHAQWSPDGQNIVFISDRDDGDMDVYVMKPDGTDITCLVDWEGEETHPTWSPGLGTNIPPTTNPISVTNTESLTPTISWTYGDADGDPQMSYEVEVWTGPGGSGINEWSPDIVSSQFTSVIYAGNSLVSGKIYYVRVRAFDGVNWGGWSETSWIPFENLHSEIMNKLSDKSYYDRINLMNPDFSTNLAVVTMMAVGADDEYYALYDISLESSNLRAASLKTALDFLREGNGENAEKYIQVADEFGTISNDAYQLSTALFIDVMDDGIFVAGQVKYWSRFASDVGLTVLCPPAGQIFDYIYIGVDFTTDQAIYGTDQAWLNLITNAIVEKTFTSANLDALGGQTIEQYTQNTVGRGAWPIVIDSMYTPQGQIEIVTIVEQAFLQQGIDLGQSAAQEFTTNMLNQIKDNSNADSIQIIELNSPGELRVYDSQGEITGMVDGKIIEEIPYSTYDENNERVIISFAKDTYRYEVIGTGVGTYGLDVFSSKDGNVRTFSLTEIPISPRSTHQYTIGVDYLNKDIITASIDSDGDGIFEETINMMLPTASFNYSPEKPVIEQNVTFDASLSKGNIVTYKWEFGDGIESYGKIVNHSYSSDGIYTINLTVKDSNNALDIKQKIIFVSANFYNITFLPPITTMDNFNLTDGSTLPIKFIVRNSITDEFIYDDTVNVTITNSTGHLITYFTNGAGTDSVRINSTEEQYIANFHTKDYAINIGETYSVTVTFGEPDSLRGYVITYFTLIDGGKAKGKGN